MASHCTAGGNDVAATCLAMCACVAASGAGVKRSDDTGTNDALSA